MKDAGFGKEARFQLLCDQRFSDLALAQLPILFPSRCFLSGGGGIFFSDHVYKDTHH